MVDPATEAAVVFIHGCGAAHDFVVGRQGAYAEVLKRLRSARAGAEPVVVVTWITRSTFRGLSALAALLHAESVRRWRLHVVQAGVEVTEPPAAIGRLGMTLPHALAAIAAARRLGIEATIRGAPRCLLGPHAAWSEPGPTRAFAAVCVACSARERCEGVAASYLDRFGAGELRPLHAAPGES